MSGQLVPKEAMTDKVDWFQTSPRSAYSLPLARVELTFAGNSEILEVAVQDDLDNDTLLGCDIPSICHRGQLVKSWFKPEAEGAARTS